MRLDASVHLSKCPLACHWTTDCSWSTEQTCASHLTAVCVWLCVCVCGGANERRIVKRLGWKRCMNAAVYHFCHLNIIWYFCFPSRVLQGSGGSCWGLRANGPEAERQERVHCAGDPQTRSPQLWGHPVHSPFWAQVWSLHIWQCTAVRNVLWVSFVFDHLRHIVATQIIVVYHLKAHCKTHKKKKKM